MLSDTLLYANSAAEAKTDVSNDATKAEWTIQHKLNSVRKVYALAVNLWL